LELIVKPTSSPGFSIIPFNIPLHKGEVSKKFRISVPMGMLAQKYLLEWEIVNDLVPAYYTPIKRIHVIVLSDNTVPINYENVLDIPLNGHSLDTRFSVTAAPDIDF
jgi:hypothetical protein